MQSVKSSGRKFNWAAFFFGVLFAVILVAGVSLGRDVFRDLERQRTASSDNVQWTLTQVEVEYLSYLNALERFTTANEAMRDFSEPAVRTQFDVFYSRVDTLASSPLFRNLRATEQYARPLNAVRGYLEAAIPTIDSASGISVEDARLLLTEARALQTSVRELSLSGLTYFANLSDTRRSVTAQTLIRLGIIAIILLLMLTALAGYLMLINTKMRQRGRALKQANTRVRTVMATSLEAVIVVNAEGHVLEFNPAAERIFQRSRDEALGKSIGELIVPEHLRDAHDAGMERMKKGGARHVVGKGRVQLEAVRANGEVFPVELALESAFSGSEEIVIGFVRDISKRVAAETELISARDKALAGEKAKDNFLTVMSHEIRTPLNGILGNLSLLTNTSLTADQKKLTGNMQVSGQVLMNHVNSVLDIARFEAGKLTAVSEKVDLNAMMQDIVDGQSGNAASKGNVITWEWTSEAQPWVLTDEQRLRQILLNLVGNAIKFTDEGRISLEVECTPQHGRPGMMEYEFRVIDTGIGISEEDQTRVFEDFETSDHSVTRNISGTGLGLGIARRFIQTLGGEIGVESELGEGSVFWLRLPMEQTTPETHSDEGKSVTRIGEALDVLVVEDNEINSEVVRRMLELDDHSVTLAEHGQAGVMAAEDHRFDVILMDISMPVMDGVTATKHIRGGKGKNRNTPIIAVSANVLPSATQSFREAGMNAFLGKPLTIASLRHALSAVLNMDTSKSADTAELSPFDDLREQLGAEKVGTLLAKFMSEGDALSDQLGQFIKTGKPSKDLAALCHKLAGSAGILGMHAYHKSLQECETGLLTDKLDDARKAAEECRAAWADMRPTLETELTRI